MMMMMMAVGLGNIEKEATTTKRKNTRRVHFWIFEYVKAPITNIMLSSKDKYTHISTVLPVYEKSIIPSSIYIRQTNVWIDERKGKNVKDCERVTVTEIDVWLCR